MKISYRVKDGIYSAHGPRGYACVANSPEQLKAYLDAHFGAGSYELDELPPLPAIGQPFPGQGGIYAGFMPARNGAAGYHLILGDELPGRFEWGPYGESTDATSLTDGPANTRALLASVATYPAAKAAAAHTADGHNDFYLPAAAELYEIWLNLNGKLAGWVWSSSLRSANYAFTMHFDVGTQHNFAKNFELRVRPVRRFIQ